MIRACAARYFGNCCRQYVWRRGRKNGRRREDTARGYPGLCVKKPALLQPASYDQFFLLSYTGQSCSRPLGRFHVQELWVSVVEGEKHIESQSVLSIKQMVDLES